MPRRGKDCPICSHLADIHKLSGETSRYYLSSLWKNIYTQVEHRKLMQAWGTKNLRPRLSEAYRSREIMAKKIENRDKAEKRRRDDWFTENDRDPATLSS